MTYPPYVREKARQLRIEKQLTIDEIAERLAISRTTIFYWVSDIEIPRRPGSSFDLTARQKGSLAMQAKYRALREAAYLEGERLYDELAREPGFKVFVAMYMAEGYKRDRNTVSLANSDPAIIKMATRWIARFASNPLDFRFQHHADQSPKQLRNFWASVLDVEPKRIIPHRKSNSGALRSRTWRCVHGVLTVRTSDTYFRARLEAWMDRLKEDWEAEAAEPVDTLGT